MKKFFLSLLVIVCLSSPAFAASWYYVGRATPSNTVLYIDNASVYKNEYAAIVWLKKVSPDGRRGIARMYFTHTPPTYTLLSAVYYAPNGSVIRNVEIPANRRRTMSIPPDTMVDNVWHLIWSY